MSKKFIIISALLCILCVGCQSAEDAAQSVCDEYNISHSVNNTVVDNSELSDSYNKLLLATIDTVKLNVLSVSEGECNCEVTYADLDSLVEQTISDSAFIQDYYKLNETQSSETASKDLICDYLTVAIGNANVKKIDTQIVIPTMSDEEVAIALRKQADEQNKGMNRTMIILFIIALIYTILPDPVPGPVDDAAVDGALGIAILVLKIVAEQKASKFVKDHKDEYIRAIGSKISNESVKQVYDSEIKKASDAWEVREKQKSENLAAQVSQAKTKYAADSTHAETTQNSMDVF